MHLTWTVPVGETREMFLDNRRSANMGDGETLLMVRYIDCNNLYSLFRANDERNEAGREHIDENRVVKNDRC